MLQHRSELVGRNGSLVPILRTDDVVEELVHVESQDREGSVMTGFAVHRFLGCDDRDEVFTRFAQRHSPSPPVAACNDTAYKRRTVNTYMHIGRGSHRCWTDLHLDLCIIRSSWDRAC